jgi:thioredoxin-dependent peroxiredoxin
VNGRKRVSVGDKLPDFSLPSQRGEMVHIREHVGKKGLVIYFYPKDQTRICTIESCAFRDNYEAFREAGAEVFGISSDSAESHRRFADEHRLPFTLLSDEQGKVRKLFGVPATLWLLPGRVTYIVDHQGIVRHIFNSQLNANAHIEQALKVLRSLR